MAVDGSGNAYITGYTASDDFPTKNPIQESYAGYDDAFDAFVAKINAAGSALVYSTYLGGSGSDLAAASPLMAAGTFISPAILPLITSRQKIQYKNLRLAITMYLSPKSTPMDRH